jgi:hypothetical protein
VIRLLMADIDPMRVFRHLLDTAVRFEAKAARHARLDTERRALQEAITQAQLVLSVSGKEPKKTTAQEAVAPSEDVMEASALLRALPGGRAMRTEGRTMPKKQRPIGRKLR